MLSKLAKSINLSSTLAISARAKKLEKEGVDVIGLSAGEPDSDTPDFIKEAARKALRDGLTKYTPAGGMPELRKAAAEKLKKENGLNYSPQEVMINCGAKHSLFNVIMCLTEKGEEVIIPSPYWVSYPEMVKAAGGVPVFADCLSSDSFKLTPEILREKITGRTKLLIINSPSNPSGCVYTKEELSKIAEIVLENDIYVISDEIYEKHVYEGSFFSIASLSEEIKKRTIIINGVSKAYSMTGWRIGYAAGGEKLISACIKLQSHSTSNPTSFAQAGALEALTSDKSEKAVSDMIEKFKERRDYIYGELSKMNPIEVTKPRGAFYIFPRIKSLTHTGSSTEFANKFLEEKHVAVIPGEGFGAGGYIRISYAAQTDLIKEGIERLKSFLGEKDRV